VANEKGGKLKCFGRVLMRVVWRGAVVFLQAWLISTEVERAVYDADLDLFSIQNYDRRSIDKL
jgi:hypothetical protein